MIPIAGSAYTYGYATLGEFVAWIIGWDLILEYLFGAATVAVGWSGYFVAFLGTSASTSRRVHAAPLGQGTHTLVRPAASDRRPDHRPGADRRTTDRHHQPAGDVLRS